MNRRRDDPQPLSAALETVMRSLDGGRRRGPSAETFGGLFGRWEEVVGADVARQVEPLRLDGTTLVVEVADPAWATQIRLLSDTMRARIEEVLGVDIAVVEVVVGGAAGRRRAGGRGNHAGRRPERARPD